MNKSFEQKETKADSVRPSRSPANAGIQMPSRGKLASCLTGRPACGGTAPEDGRCPGTDTEARVLKILNERLWHFTSVGLGNCRAAQRVRREIECRQRRGGTGVSPVSSSDRTGEDARATIEQLTAGLAHLESVGLANSCAAQIVRGELQRRITLNSQLATLNHLRLANDGFDSNEPRDKDGKWTKEGEAIASNTNSPSQTSTTTKPDNSFPLKPTGAPKEETYAEPASTLEGIAGLLDLAGEAVRDTVAADWFALIGDPQDALKQAGATSDQLKAAGFKDVEEDSGTTGEKPFEQGMQTLPPVPRAISRGAEGIVKSAPRVAIAEANPALGALAFGATTEGFDAKQAILTAVLPLVSKYTGEITAAIAVRAKVSPEIAQQAFRAMGGAAGVTAVIGADQLQQIMKLPPEQRKQALIDAAGMLGAMFILGMLGGGKPGEGNAPEGNAANPQEPAAYLERAGTTGKWSYPNAPEAKAQIQNLRQWAQATGRVQNFEPPPGAKLLGGNERDGYLDPKTNRVYKRTDPPGTFGFLGVGPNLERTATPYSYLQRIALMNQAFDSDIRVEGITPGDRPSIITSEPYYEAPDGKSPHPSEMEIETFMQQHGFERLPNVADGWSREKDGIKAYDARPENFIKTGDNKIVPVDLVLQRGWTAFSK